MLDLVVDRVRRLPVLLTITFRPEFQAPWSGRSHVTSLVLNRLDEANAKALVQNLAGHVGLTAEMVMKIVERADGVPLFLEELTKAVLESAEDKGSVVVVPPGKSFDELSVPATLHASLVARLDRLAPVSKEVAQIGAVLGREFAYSLIKLWRSARRQRYKPRWLSSATRDCCFVGAPLHTLLICLSMPSFRMPLIVRCYAQNGRNCTVASLWCWSRTSIVG
jgi:hypothetical protein